jgi:hypothetical protein
MPPETNYWLHEKLSAIHPLYNVFLTYISKVHFYTLHRLAQFALLGFQGTCWIIYPFSMATSLKYPF